MSKLFWNIASSSPNRIGAITCQYTILQNHIALNGDIKEQASINYTELLDFFRENNLIAESLEDYNNNKSLCYYNESEDSLKLPDFTDYGNPLIAQIRYRRDEDIIPTGTIIHLMGTIAPNGYLFCNGDIFKLTDFYNLANYFKDQFGSYNFFGGDGETTFAVPDLRGEFLRCTGTATRDTGSGDSVGIHQDATIISTVWGTKNNDVLVAENINDSKAWDIGALNQDSSVTLSSTYRDIGHKNDHRTHPFPTTRPTNTSVLYCIKY